MTQMQGRGAYFTYDAQISIQKYIFKKKTFFPGDNGCLDSALPMPASPSHQVDAFWQRFRLKKITHKIMQFLAEQLRGSEHTSWNNCFSLVAS